MRFSFMEGNGCGSQFLNSPMLCSPPKARAREPIIPAYDEPRTMTPFLFPSRDSRNYKFIKIDSANLT